MPRLESFSESLRSIVESAKLPRSGLIPNSLIYRIEDEPEEEKVEAVVEKEKFKYQYPPEVLVRIFFSQLLCFENPSFLKIEFPQYGDSGEDSHEDFDVRLTLSQIAELEAFGEEEMNG